MLKLFRTFEHRSDMLISLIVIDQFGLNAIFKRKKWPESGSRDQLDRMGHICGVDHTLWSMSYKQLLDLLNNRSTCYFACPKLEFHRK